MNPRGRRNDLEIQWVADELMVYDLRSDRAHCLAPLTARVWEHADGTADVAALAQVLGVRNGLVATPDEVSEALRALAEAGLLEDVGALEDARVTRRDLIRDAAAVGALVAGAGALKSILAPTPAAAQSGPGGPIL